MSSSRNSERENSIEQLIAPIGNDLLSGAAEIALQGITVLQSIISSADNTTPDELKQDIEFTSQKLIDAQPAMASLFNIANSVIRAISDCNTVVEIKAESQKVLDHYEKLLCDSVAKIADFAFDLIPPGEIVFAYSFSSTVLSCLLNARAKGRYFRVACSESRPSMEGRKLATLLASGGIEVISTFDSAMGMLLPSCSVAFMGCDCIGAPGLVNKTGSFLLALACHELKIPLYALCDTTKFVGEDRFFEFENHQRPGMEVWDDAPPEVSIVNRQFELIPFDYITGLVTEKGLFAKNDLAKYITKATKDTNLSAAAPRPLSARQSA
jgi:translation initiation factor eIF-2B subunit delta